MRCPATPETVSGSIKSTDPVLFLWEQQGNCEYILLVTTALTRGKMYLIFEAYNSKMFLHASLVSFSPCRRKWVWRKSSLQWRPKQVCLRGKEVKWKENVTEEYLLSWNILASPHITILHCNCKRYKHDKWCHPKCDSKNLLCSWRTSRFVSS